MLRPSLLAGSWYPDNTREIDAVLSGWTQNDQSDSGLFSAVVPHAGWYFSGCTAARAMKRMCAEKDLIIVIGGHLPAGSSIIAAYEDAIETPSGNIRNRLDYIGNLSGRIRIAEDVFNDNTVEVVMPMVKYFAPDSDVIWLRAPADENSILLGEEIFRLAADEGIRIAVAGSTDLTHYGDNYGYAPAGRGEAALKWARDINDAELISLLIDFRLEEAIRHAEEKRSACSIGAAAAAARFAELNKSAAGTLVEYSNSYDKAPSDSFVGYAGIVY